MQKKNHVDYGLHQFHTIRESLYVLTLGNSQKHPKNFAILTQ